MRGALCSIPLLCPNLYRVKVLHQLHNVDEKRSMGGMHQAAVVQEVRGEEST